MTAKTATVEQAAEAAQIQMPLQRQQLQLRQISNGNLWHLPSSR